jgi:hypothetical protein
MRYAMALLTTPNKQKTFEGLDKETDDLEVATTNAYDRAKEVMGSEVPPLEDMNRVVYHVGAAS